MSVSYSYTLGIDFTATDIDIPTFQAQIQASTISSASVQYIVRSGSIVTIYFNGTLSAPDLITLNSLVSSYTFSTSTGGVEVDTNSSQLISNKQLTTSNTIVDATTPSKSIGFSLAAMTTSTQLTLVSELAASYSYTFKDAGANSNILMSDSAGTQTITTGDLALASSSALTLANTSISTSSTTGALQVAGGAYFGTNSLFAGSVTLSGAAATLALSGATSVVTLANTAASTSSTTGALRCLGGAYFGTNSLFAGSVTLSGAAAILALSGATSVVTLANTAASTSSTTGALRCLGGAYFGTNSLFAGSVTLSGAAAILALSGATSAMTLAGTAASTSSTTGALRCLGGAYFGTNSLFAGSVTLSGAAATLALSGATSVLTLAGTTASTSSTTGALQVAGGAYFGAASLFGNDLTVTKIGGASTLYIDCQGSTTNIGQLIFKNSGGNGDFAIYGDGGDVWWQGGGSRNLQMAAWHGIVLSGGRQTTAQPTFLAGTGGAYNTLINNEGNSVGLIVRGSGTQAVNLQEWQNSANTTLAAIDSVGELIINATAASTSSTTGALQVAGGAYFGASSVFNSNVTANSAQNQITIPVFRVIASGAGTSTTSTATFVAISGLSVTPDVPGTYLIHLEAQFYIATANRTAVFALALNGTAIANTTTYVYSTLAIAAATATTGFQVVSITAYQAFNGTTDVLTALHRLATASTLNTAHRTIYAMRISD